jgi:DNA-binding transcriptional MerR regulator
MSAQNDTSHGDDRSVAEVDRIRDIIFGSQMRGYEQQFKRIASQLDLLGNQLEELRAALDRQRADQESRTRQVEEEMRQRNSEMERSFSERQGKLEASLEQQTTQLASDMRKQGQDLRAELTAAADALEDAKAGRHDLGDLLVEMGTRLKQQPGVADLLGQLEALTEEQPSE